MAELARRVLVGAPVLVLVVGPDGRIRYVNPRFEAVTGLESSTLVGADAIDTFEDEEQRDATRSQFRAALRGDEPWVLVRRLATRGGEALHIEWTAQVWTDASGAKLGLLCIGHDVTAHLRLERSLQHSEAQLKEAQHLAQLGSWQLDLRTNKLEWTDEIYRIFELDPTSFGASYEAFLATVHPDDRSAVDAAYTHSVVSHEPYRIAHRLLMPDGRIKQVEERGRTFYAEDGTPLRSVGTVQDVTRQHEAETALRQARDRLAATLQAIPDLLFELDEEGRYVGVHAARPELMFVKAEEVIGRNVRELLPPEASRVAAAALDDAAKWGASFGRTYELALPDGPRWFELSVSHRPQEDQSRAAFVALCRDVTDRERARRVLNESLAQKDVLLRELNHRVKNSLQVISSLLYLQGRKAAGAAVRTTLEDMQHRIRAMALVHELLSDGPGIDRIDFATYLRHLGESLAVSQSAPRGVRIVVDSIDVSLAVDSAVPCGLIVNELVTNALKHAFPDGRNGTVRLAFGRDGDGAFTLTVADDGVGLPETLPMGAQERLGLQLVRALVGQLRAAHRVDRSAGTLHELTFRD